MQLVATCLFGLEGLLGEEIDSLGYKRINTIDGRVTFEAPPEAVAVCNINLRTAERVLIKIGEFRAYSFDSLFEGTKALPWSDYIGKNDAFPVKGHSIRSKLFSIPDCQKIIKKAVVNSLSEKYNIKIFPEIGVKYQIEFFILNDNVTLMIDTTGVGLHKRGYRALAGVAPMRETLAAAMVKLSRMRDNVIICDPLCGSGTIAIEAAQMACNIAPGINRGFAAEDFSFLPKDMWRTEREVAKSKITEPLTQIFGSDIDSEMVNLARDNAKKAGVEKAVSFSVADARNFVSPVIDARGTIITNPPYGERLGELSEARDLYKAMGKQFEEKIPFWQKYIITSDEMFERYFGRRSDKKRVLYNGMIKCNLYQYFKPRKN
ncbi:MAG: class I SAM-dependent RNA methyltransferase [Ruminococcaceae bacterium]|nr:class I SAM-dependent RNA methyltransferase [Oscillospiraceae bacterium]